MRSPLLPSALWATCLALGACASTAPAPAPKADAPPPIGMANPASQFCAAQGGRSRLVRTPQGEHSLCRLPDGREVEEWAYFREMHPQPKP